MNPDRRILLIATCLGVLVISIFLLSGEEEVITNPKDMSTSQLIEHLDHQDTPPRADVAREVLRRQPEIIEQKNDLVYVKTVSTLKQSLYTSSEKTKNTALKTLISYPELQKEFKVKDEADVKKLKETTEAINKKIGQKRYEVVQIGDHVQIKTNFVLRPVKVQKPQ